MATIKLETDPTTGDLILPLSDELMRDVGWKIGDTIRWTEQKDGSWHLTKVQEQLELDFDEKDDAILTLLTENQRLKDENELLKREISEFRKFYDDDYK